MLPKKQIFIHKHIDIYKYSWQGLIDGYKTLIDLTGAEKECLTDYHILL